MQETTSLAKIANSFTKVPHIRKAASCWKEISSLTSFWVIGDFTTVDSSPEAWDNDFLGGRRLSCFSLASWFLASHGGSELPPPPPPPPLPSSSSFWDRVLCGPAWPWTHFVMRMTLNLILLAPTPNTGIMCSGYSELVIEPWGLVHAR